jgi:HK97 family phage portal protein
MRLLGLDISRAKAAPALVNASPVASSGNWYTVFQSMANWPTQWFQTDTPLPGIETLLAFHAVYACETLIAGDIGKLRYMLIEYDAEGLWKETASAAFSPVLRRPNRYQNHIQFKEWWITSKLTRGNAYVLKERDARGIVTAMYLLDPCRVTPLVAPDGGVYYDLGQDYLAGLEAASIVVPASEVIHDRMNCLFHPLVGISPLFASGLAADQGLRMQRDGKKFFGNNSNPGGVLTAPGEISDALAKRMKDEWERNFTGENAGRIAVLGDGLKFEPMRMSAVDAQVIEQLNMTAAMVCSTFHVPAYMIGVGPVPPVNNVEALAQQYYSQCLQILIEQMEQCLSDGLGLDTPKGGAMLDVALDLEGLLRMDTRTQMETLKLGVGSTILTPNEARKKINQKPQAGGDALYLQVQNYSLEALAARDAALPAPGTAGVAAPEPAPTETPPADDDAAKALSAMQRAFETAEV